MTADAPRELEPGQRFAGRYVVERSLGRGGMGAVYRVHDEALGESVALKILELDDDEGDDDAVERFRREVRLARKVTHPNVVRTHDLGEHEGLHFLTMECVEGEDLGALLAREGPLPLARALDIGHAIASGLAAAHGAGVIHRDLKPRNILLDAAGTVRITDFGIARAVKRDDALMTDGVVGTPAYMAPEQVRATEVDQRADLYALGLVLYEMVTGKRPFLTKSPLSVAIARLEQRAPDPRDTAPVPDALAELILSCLAIEPDDRPSSARIIASRLAALAPLATTAPPLRPIEHPRDDSNPKTGTTRYDHAPASTADATALTRHEPRLAVLPFVFRGSDEHTYLGDTFTDELIDVLCRTRGLAVLASGATAGYRDKRDPRVVGRELDVDAVVDGTIQSAGPRVRVSARLSDARSGVQLATEKCEGLLADVFDLHDTLSRRVAEALRVSIATASQGMQASSEAVELYLRGRKQLRELAYRGDSGAVALFGRAAEMAPDFAPAAAALAIACARAWFIPSSDRDQDFSKLAREALARAKDAAPDLAETHFAEALVSSQVGDHARMAIALRTALQIAPAYADALEALGTLELETGRWDRGLAHAELALDLDPTLTMSRIALARHFAITGDDERFSDQIAELERGPQAGGLSVLQLVYRRAGWRADTRAAREVAGRLPPNDHPSARMARLYVDVVLGNVTPTSVASSFREIIAAELSPRFRVFLGQLGVEVLGLAGAIEEAMAELDTVTRLPLPDLTWVDLCPALDPLRGHAGFQDARDRVRARVGGIWAV